MFLTWFYVGGAPEWPWVQHPIDFKPSSTNYPMTTVHLVKADYIYVYLPHVSNLMKTQ